jgi:transposase
MFTQKNKTTSLPTRERVVALWQQGESFKSIASKLGISNRTASNIITNVAERGHLLALRPGGKERHIANPNVVEHIEYQKLDKPSTTTVELQAALVRDGVCTPENLPSRSTISDILRKDLQYTYKKLHVVPEESRTETNQARMLNYIMEMSEIDSNRVHFFDECSVKTTTGNRIYGHARKGKPAIEIKRYASHCNYTVNLLQSVFGITNFGILEGASNGLEMLHFFNESLQIVDPIYGNPVLSNGDVVVMDNCGFHHGRFAEPELRRILGERGVTLIFQPPYSPEFNTCEFSFRVLKQYLRKHEHLSINFTEVAILRALEEVTPEMCRRFFHHCGFLV